VKAVVLIDEYEEVSCMWRLLQYIIMKCFRRGTFSTSHDLQYESRATCPFQCKQIAQSQQYLSDFGWWLSEASYVFWWWWLSSPSISSLHRLYSVPSKWRFCFPRW